MENKHIQNFLRYLLDKGVSTSSLKYYKSDISNFLFWAGNRKVDNKLVREYINNERLTTPIATLNRRLSTLRSYSNFIGQDFMIGIENVSNLRKVARSWQDAILNKFEAKPKLKNLFSKMLLNRPNWYRKYHSYPLASYIHIAILILFSSLSGYAVYDQVFYSTDRSLAFPSALERPNRFLSFQGRLTDNLGNPETTATNVVFNLYSVSSGGSSLWNSGTCSITPDQDGIFSTLLGSSCGSEIASSVFSENADIWLGVTVGADAEATPRIQIATVAYALNSETLQGYPAGTGTSTIPYIDSTGKLAIAAASPTIESTSGTFAVTGQAMTISTANTTNGDITINPDGTGSINLNFEGTAPDGGANGFVNAVNANITSGSLYSGTVASNATGYNFINFLSGSSPVSVFSVQNDGDILTSGDITIGGGNINTGNIALTIGDGTTDSVTISTDGTGNGELVLPNDSIGPNELLSSGQTDEYCLTYETTGTTFEWQTCGSAGGGAWNDLTDPDGNLSLNHTTYTTAFNWDTGTGSNDLFSLTTDNSSNGTGTLLNIQTGTSSTVNPFRVRAGSLEAIYVDALAKVGVGTNAPISRLSVINNPDASNYTGKSSLLIDQYESQDILTASASGTTKFALLNDGTLKLYDSSTILNNTGNLIFNSASGNFDFSGDSVTNLNILNATSGIFSSVIQAGHTSATTYSRLGSATTSHAGNISSASDILLQDIEIDGTLFLDSGTISNSAGTASVILSSSVVDTPNTLSAGNWLVENTANVGQSALMINQTKSGDLFTASSSGTPKFTIHNDGSITLATNISSTSNSTEGTIFYDNNSAGSSSTDHLFMYGSDNAWHRIALDMTKYASTSASINNQGYIEIAHNQNTNDLSLTGWFYDTTTSLWTNIKDKIGSFLHNLDNQFNPVYAQKYKASTVALDYSINDLGTGADGAITISSNKSINTNDSITGRTCDDSSEGGDAVNYSVTALTSTTATLESAPATACLAVGDEVLLINLRGNSTSFVNAGNYETLRIQSISSNVVTFTTSKTKYYGDGSGDDTNIGVGTSAQAVMLQRVPNYTNVTVDASYNFYPDEWVQPTGAVNNGAGEGGVMFFRATGAVTINGTIHATGKGYIAGAGSGSYGASTTGGEAYCGTNNTGGGAGGHYASRNGTAGSCGGGGGAGIYIGSGGAGTGGSGSSTRGGAGGGGGSGYYYTGGGGGGGGYGAGGNGGYGYTNGTNGSTNASGNGGNGTETTNGMGGGGGGGSYGDANLDDLMFGSSGAGGGGFDGSHVGGNGGDGGGIVYIAGNTITVNGNLSANGSAGSSGTGSYGGGGGGGAGGSIKVVGSTVNLGGSTKTTATAGSGGSSTTYAGGAGGTGRIAAGAGSSLSNTSNPSYTSLTVGYNTYALFVSDEISTPNATDLTKLTYTFDQNSYGMVQFQTRTGKSNNATDGSWEAWKPAVSDTNIKSLNAMDATSDWTVTNLNAAADGVLARNVDEFEDEDITSAANKSVKFGSVGSSSGYAEDTISSTDLSNYDLISAWVYATSSGNIVKLGFGESTGTEQEETITVDTANTWQKVYWDISDVDESLKNAVTKLRVSLLSTNTTVYVDSLQAERLMNSNSSATISSTPNDYLQYRAILTTTNIAFQPKLFNVQAEWSNGFKIVQTDANTVRLYNYSGASQQLRLDAVVFGADLAEWYTIDDQTIEAGDLVSLTGQTDEYGVPILSRSSTINDAKLIGAISTKAGQSLGIEAENRRLLGLAGRIPVKIDPNSPDIKSGDELTSSNIPGRATLAMPGDRSIGKATENWTSESNKETVLILIDNSYAPNSNTLIGNAYRYLYDTRGLIDQTTDRIVSEIGAFALVISPEVKTNMISPIADSDLIIDLDPESATASSKLAIKGVDDKEVSTIDASGNADFAGQITSKDLEIANNATISGTLYASTLYADNIESTRLSEIEELLSEVETNQQLHANSGNWDINTATESTSLNTFDELYATNLVVSEQLAVTSLFISNNLTTDNINSLEGPLQIQSLATTPLEIMAGKISIDTNGDTKFLSNVEVAGNLTINNLVVAQNIDSTSSTPTEIVEGETNSNAVAGKAILLANTDLIKINNPKVTEDSLVYVTPISPTQNKVLYVKSKGSGYFEIGFSEPLDSDVEFNWWIIKLQGNNLTN